MATCNCCGAELTPKDKFCWQCGTKVEQKLYCTNCGAELTPKDKFCWQCGSPVPAPAAPARVRPASFQPVPAAQTVGNLEDTYPNVKGFYEAGRCRDTVSVSDRAIVWADGVDLFRLGKNEETLLKREYAGSHVLSTVQTPDSILTAEQVELDREYEYGDYTYTYAISVKKYDDDLHLLSTRKWEVPQRVRSVNDVKAALSEHYLFIVSSGREDYKSEEDYESEEDNDFIFTRICLDDDSTVEVSAKSACVNGTPIDAVYRLLADSGVLYVDGRTDVHNANMLTTAVVDFDAGTVNQIWKDRGIDWSSGKPHFFDFAKKIMWTELTKDELRANNISESGYERKIFMVPRRIEPNARILGQISPLVFHTGQGTLLSYFDGENYLSNTSFSIAVYPNKGRNEVDWGDHITEPALAVVWPEQGLVLGVRRDANDNTHYLAYSLDYDPKNRIGSRRKLREVKVKESEDK